MAHLAFELFGTSEIEEGHVHVPSVVSCSSLLQTFMSYLLPLLEVFLNLALLATCLSCLFLLKHLSTCLSASPTSCSHPTLLLCHEEMNGALSLARLFRELLLRIGKCQSLTGGGEGREAGWKMSPFTGKSCEPRNTSAAAATPTPPPLVFPLSLSVGAQWGFICMCVLRVVKEERGGLEVTQHIFSPVKTGGRCLWEEADTRLKSLTWNGKRPSAEETRGSISRWGGSLFRLEGSGWILAKD